MHVVEIAPQSPLTGALLNGGPLFLGPKKTPGVFFGPKKTPGVFFSAGSAYGVSADGWVVVGSSGGDALRWTQATGIVLLGSRSAHGASGDGSAVVGSSGGQAFRWTQATGMVGLGDLPGGAFTSLALRVSADGAVAVGRSESASGVEAFRWTQATGMVGLGDRGLRA